MKEIYNHQEIGTLIEATGRLYPPARGAGHCRAQQPRE